MDIREIQVEAPSPIISPEVVVPVVVSQSNDILEQPNDIQNPQDDIIVSEPVIVQEEIHEPQDQLRRSIRERRSAISDDYVVYAVENECDLSIDEDLVSFKKAMESDNSENWLIAMKEEIKSMGDNKVWDLAVLPEGCKSVGFKWVFKTKRDSKGNIERYKDRLVAKGFTQKNDIDYKETFALVQRRILLELFWLWWLIMI